MATGAVPSTTAAVTPTRRRAFLRTEEREALIMLLPWAVGFLAFSIGPMIASFILMFMDWDLLTAPSWTGLTNLVEMVHDKLFWISLGNTAYFAFISVPLYLFAALLVAVALNARIVGVKLYRVVYFIPSQTPAVANALLWLWIFNPEFGLANAVLGWFHIPPQQWFFDGGEAKPALIILGLWGIGSSMVIFLAGLQGIPQTLYEAAEVDGAAGWRRFWNITLPMLTPIIFFQLILGIINSFQAGFVYVYIITQGGPDNATLLYILNLYNQAFNYFHMGYASALAWTLFLVVVVFTALQFRLAQRWVYYEGG
ncbi:MAG: sugar ABC transporter permease [Chloroflexi bacterium]|nr:sugar ABC transporter permease [Chloroflexota bacterium]